MDQGAAVRRVGRRFRRMSGSTIASAPQPDHTIRQIDKMVRNELDDNLYPSDSENAEEDPFTPAANTDDDNDSLQLLSDDDDQGDGSGSRQQTPMPAPTGAHKSQFSANKWDLIRVSANRFTYSKEYIFGYIVLTLLSTATVAISLAAPKGCPHLSFYIFEIIVLVALMLEVALRMLALRRFFFKSWWNIMDAVLMVICAVTLGLVFAGCSSAVRRSRQSSTVLLVIRNVVQIIRIVNLIWRNRSNINNRQIDIDLDNVEDMGFALLPEEEDPEHFWSVDDDDDRRGGRR